MTKKDALAKILTAMEQATMAADTAKRLARRRQYHAVADAFRNCAALVQKIEVEPFENLEELRLKAEFLDRMADDPEERVVIEKEHRPTDGPKYFVLYREPSHWAVAEPQKVLFRASGHTLAEAIRNVLACEGQWKKKKAPDERGLEE